MPKAKTSQTRSKPHKMRSSELDRLRRRLQMAEETLRAITSGEVDALVVSGLQGDQLFTLQDANRPYRHLVEQMSEGACSLNTQGIVLFANSYLVHLLGIPLEEILGQPLSRWVWTPDRARFDRLFQEASESNVKGELAFVSATRDLLPVELSLSLLQTEEGPRITAVLFDLRERKLNELALRGMNQELEQHVTERTAELERVNRQFQTANEQLQFINQEIAVANEEFKTANDELARANQKLEAEVAERRRIEEALRRSEEQANDLIRYAPTAIYEIDFPEQRLTQVNDAMCQMSGYSREELLALSPFDLLDEDSQKRFRARIQEALKGEPVDESVEYRVKAKDGREMIAVLKTRLLHEAGKPVRALVIAHDITDRKQVEEKISGLNRDLERRSTELAATNRELESFSYSVSHDLRTPLTSIESLAHLALEDYGTQLSEQVHEVLSLIQANAQATTTLVEDLLRFSRTSRLPLNKQPVEMSEMVSQVLNELRATPIDRLGLVVGELNAANADPILIKQVWTNLLSNAIKYTRSRDKARIEIGMERHDGQEVYFVKDNGVGFDMAQADKLFGVFQRLHSEEEYEGTGVGLAIVERIIRRHGGRVWAEAEVDRGATFFFTLGT
ncbi:MAG: PAS domain S-box protein [Acidobacteriota bacterium]